MKPSTRGGVQARTPALRDRADAAIIPDTSPDVRRSLAIVCNNLLRQPSELLSIGPFQLSRTLGRGGHGVVYKAFDPSSDEWVALKVLHDRGPSMLSQLKREFRSLAELRHENLVELHALTIAQDHAYFTMELVEGHDFVRHVREVVAHAPRPALQLRALVAQLCEGVQAVHGAGKLHRDLKPSNLLVTASGRLVILDFGLAHDSGSVAVQGYAGTPSYMAPEQVRGSACEGSDWYGVGRCLQEALQALRAQGQRRGELALAIDELACMESLVARLLQADPARRPGFEDIMLVVQGARPASPRWSTSSRERGFIGRDAELRTLAAAYQRSATRSVFLVVHGESGIGKSALLEHFITGLSGRSAGSSEADPQAPIVLRGRCHERESVPYKALDGVLDELGQLLRGLPPGHALRQTSLDTEALLAVFPVLASVPWLQAAASPLRQVHPTALRAHASAALRRLLALLGRTRPLILCIDDLQWSDDDSGTLLAALLCEADSPRMLVLASERTDSSAWSPCRALLQRAASLSPLSLQLSSLQLGSLSPLDALQLARALVDQGAGSGSAAAERIARAAGGHPFILRELARSLSGCADVAGLADTRELSAEELIGQRLESLQQSARALLQVLAIAGGPLPTRVVSLALGAPQGLRASIRELSGAGLVRVARTGPVDWLELEHHLVGCAIRERLEPGQRRSLHGVLARALQEERCPDSEVLLEQYIGAGMRQEAAECARRLAQTAFDGVAFARATRLYEQALELGTWPRPARATLRANLALALEYAGQGLAAAAAYARAIADTDDALMATQLEQRAADNLIRHGRHREGEALLRRGYARLGLRWPTGRARLVLSVLRLLTYEVLPHGSRRTRRGDATMRRRRADYLARAGRGLECYDLLRAGHNALLCMRTAEQLEDPGWQAQVKASRGFLRCVSGAAGLHRGGLGAIEQACVTAQELGDLTLRADLERQLAFVHYMAGDAQLGLDAALRSEACFRLLPEWYIDRIAVAGVAGAALYDLGRLRDARTCLQGMSESARLHTDLMTTIWVHAQPVQISLGLCLEDHERVQALLEHVASLRRAHPRYGVLGWILALGKVEQALHAGEGELALHHCHVERAALSVVLPPLFHAHTRLLRARAHVAAAAATRPGLERSALLWRARVHAVGLRRSLNRYMRARGALVEAAIERLAGRRDRAALRIEAALSALGSSEARVLGPALRHCRGALLGGDAGRALQDAACIALASEGIERVPRFMAWTTLALTPLRSCDG